MEEENSLAIEYLKDKGVSPNISSIEVMANCMEQYAKQEKIKLLQSLEQDEHPKASIISQLNKLSKQK